MIAQVALGKGSYLVLNILQGSAKNQIKIWMKNLK